MFKIQDYLVFTPNSILIHFNVITILTKPILFILKYILVIIKIHDSYN